MSAVPLERNRVVPFRRNQVGLITRKPAILTKHGHIPTSIERGEAE
jgi:hypothetical protein